MAFKSFPVALGATDTDVFECPAATEAAAVLLVSNVSASSRTYTLKFYKASTGVTKTLLSGVSIAANTAAKVPTPLSLEAGDKIIMSCSNANDVVVGGTITLGATVEVISTFVAEGEWNSGTTYTENVSIVTRNGNSYLARPNEAENLNQDPATATDFWMLLAAKGETGDGDLSAANNLSDLSDLAQAVTNLANGNAFLRAATEGQGPITGGAGITPKDLGTVGTATLTVDPRARAIQKATSNGTTTLGELSHEGACVLWLTMASGAGSPVTSAWDKVDGDAFTTTNGHKFRIHMERVDSYSYMFVRAMQ